MLKKIDKESLSFAKFCIFSIAVVEVVALVKNIDGLALFTALSSIFAIAGWYLRGNKQKKDVDRMKRVGNDNTPVKARMNMF